MSLVSISHQTHTRAKTPTHPLEPYRKLIRDAQRLSTALTNRWVANVTPEKIDHVIEAILKRIHSVIQGVEHIEPHFSTRIYSYTDSWESFDVFLRTVSQRIQSIYWEWDTTVPWMDYDNLSNIIVYSNPLSSVSVTLPRQNTSTSLLELTLFTIIELFRGLHSFLLQREKDAIKARNNKITDVLTGWLRRGVEEVPELMNPFREALRDVDSLLTVYIIDLNKFKLLNDTYGHHIWDEVLKLTVDRILSMNELVQWTENIHGLWENFLLYRSGGDEFVLYTKGIRENLTKKLKKAITQNIPLTREKNGGWIVHDDMTSWWSTDILNVQVGASIWSVRTDEGFDNLSDMKKTADERMYWDKNTGS